MRGPAGEGKQAKAKRESEGESLPRGWKFEDSYEESNENANTSEIYEYIYYAYMCIIKEYIIIIFEAFESNLKQGTELNFLKFSIPISSSTFRSLELSLYIDYRLD